MGTCLKPVLDRRVTRLSVTFASAVILARITVGTPRRKLHFDAEISDILIGECISTAVGSVARRGQIAAKDNHMQSKKNQLMSEEILTEGLAYVESVPAKAPPNPFLNSPLKSIAHPKGWETVVTVLVLAKGYNFGEVVGFLNKAWAKALAVKNAGGSLADATPQICTEAALRRRVIEVAEQRYVDARAKSSDPELDPTGLAQQRRIIDEIRRLNQRFNLNLDIPSKSELPAAPVAAKPAAEPKKSSAGAASKAKPSAVPAPAIMAEIPNESTQPPATPVTVENEHQKPDAAAESSQVDSVAKTDEPKVPPTSEVGAEKFDFLCPKCNGKMMIKTARKGENKGNRFYGCAAWRDTKCGGTRDMQGQDTTRGN